MHCERIERQLDRHFASRLLLSRKVVFDIGGNSHPANILVFANKNKYIGVKDRFGFQWHCGTTALPRIASVRHLHCF